MADEGIRIPKGGPSSRTQLNFCEFVKGIEGFDNDRAADCLGRLLDMHYDTIGVLKLATKHDLIEDVGLKPGDALRIVSAAKVAVQPPPSPPSSSLSSHMIRMIASPHHLPRAPEAHQRASVSPEPSARMKVSAEFVLRNSLIMKSESCRARAYRF